MRISLISMAVLLLMFASPARGQSSTALPFLRTVEPLSGKIGDVLTTHGSNVGAETVAALYLTDGTNDIKAEIVEQSATLIRFRIPREVKPGRHALMVLTRGKDARLVEEPVKVTVEADTSEPAS